MLLVSHDLPYQKVVYFKYTLVYFKYTLCSKYTNISVLVVYL